MLTLDFCVTETPVNKSLKEKQKQTEDFIQYICGCFCGP